MSGITTHVLDTTAGKPGAGIAVVLEFRTDASEWHDIGDGVTDADGRVRALIRDGQAFRPGQYRLIFETGAYFLLSGVECFFPRITISFAVTDPKQHYHVPLLLSPFGYTTYRGS